MTEKLIADIIPKIFEKLKENIINDSELNEFVQDKESLKKMLQRQEELLKIYLDSFEDKDIDENLCYQFYKDFEIPYAIVFKSLKLLKKDIDKELFKEGYSKEIAIDVDEYITKLIDLVSKAYIKRDIHKLKDANKKISFSNYLLFKGHNKWIDQIISSIENDNLETFPLTSDKECEFNSLMEYPESLMVCMDANLCTYLNDVHRLLHISANTFFKFYTRGDFSQAYLMFKDISENSYKFATILKDLYYITFADLESSFLKLVEMLTYSTKKQIITLIDIQNVRHLNSNYGENSINKLLDTVENSIRDEVLRYSESTLSIRGMTSNFYLLNLNWQKDEYDQFLDSIISKIKRSYKIGEKSIDIVFSICSFELEPGIKYHRDELIRIMLHLKDLAKQRGNVYKVFDTKQKQDIRKWLNERYYNINFVTQKLENKDLDMMYQPIISLKNHNLAGVEALARIRENNKLISAELFIDIIYETDNITLLDKIILDKIRSHKKRLLSVCDKIFINSAAVSLANSEYREKLSKFLEEFGTNNIIIEINEKQALKDILSIKELHKDLKVQFAIDNFGSGYTALKTVADLAMDGVIDVLKIDGTIIKEIDKKPHTRKIVEVIVNLCKTLDIKSLAEFVESQESAKALKEIGVDYLQGYYLSPPVRLMELLDYEPLRPYSFI